MTNSKLYLDPDIGVPVTGAGYDLVCLGSPVYARDPEVVLVQQRLLRPVSPAVAGVDDHVLAVVRQGQLGPGPGPGVAGDGGGSVVTFLTELLNFCHGCVLVPRTLVSLHGQASVKQL